MKRADLLTQFISMGRKRSAMDLLQKIYEETSCRDYAEAFEKLLLIETAKSLNNSVTGFYCDIEKLTKELFSEKPLSSKEAIDLLCTCVKNASRENSRRTFEKARYYIENNMCDNQLSLGFAAEYAGITQSGLVKLFVQYASVTPGEYLSKARIEKSLDMLSGGASVAAAAESVGFSSSEAYIRAFKKHMETTPGVWKRNKLFL